MPNGDCPCFSLGLAHRKVLRVFEDALIPLGLTTSQAHALTALYRQDGLLAKDLARELHIDAASVTPMLDRMERQGLVRRCKHPDDRRATRLCLEAKARDLQGAIEQALCEASDKLAQRYTPEEFETLMALMRRMSEDPEPASAGPVT